MNSLTINLLIGKSARLALAVVLGPTGISVNVSPIIGDIMVKERCIEVVGPVRAALCRHTSLLIGRLTWGFIMPPLQLTLFHHSLCSICKAQRADSLPLSLKGPRCMLCLKLTRMPNGPIHSIEGCSPSINQKRVQPFSPIAYSPFFLFSGTSQ